MKSMESPRSLTFEQESSCSVTLVSSFPVRLLPETIPQPNFSSAHTKLELAVADFNVEVPDLSYHTIQSCFAHEF